MSQLSGFEDLKRMVKYGDTDILKYIESNKQKLIDTPVKIAINDPSLVSAATPVNKFRWAIVYNKIRNMALAYDAFVAWLED